ncbi:DNA ligase [Campylobacter sputorum]|uniref:DNA ligase n=1 Tax=Campylobacter sputorum TaxID=206 RepID=UPI00053BFE22|nr:DNA ligase [Campylobacter sputorum]
MLRVCILLIFFISFINAQSRQIMLLSEYDDENLTNWYISEKLDGVRGVWDGKELKSRNGYKFTYPSNFTACFPNFALDGELYTKRGDFENISSITSKSEANNDWKELKFYIFDIPDMNVSFDKKYQKMQEIASKCKNINVIEQRVAKNNDEVFKFLDDVIKGGGEGVIARESNLIYENTRSNKILKLKKFKDSECKVLKINKGNGKYKNIMGSLDCKDIKTGVIFKIGSGFSDELRKNPPQINQIITYKYQNLTKNKKPRFPVFLRFRNEI